MKVNSKEKLKEMEPLKHYRYLINSVSHFTDIKNLDQRMFSFMIHVKTASDLSKVKGLVALKLNKLITDDTYSIAPIRPAIIITDDVEGSRDSNPNLTNPEHSHLHGVIIIPNEVFDLISDMNKFIADMEKELLLEIREVKHESSKWNAKLSVSNPAHLKTILSAIRQVYPQVRFVNASASCEAELTLFQSVRRNPIDCDKLLENIGKSFPKITKINRITDFSKMVDIRKYDQSKGSVFNLLSYNMKLMDSSGDSSFDFRVFPYESDINNKKNLSLGIEAKRKADIWFRMCLTHPTLIFSKQYLEQHGHEFEQLEKLAAHDKRIAA